MLREPLTLHRYLYVAASPTGNVDPSGKMSISATMELVTVMVVSSGATQASTSAARYKGGKVYQCWRWVPPHFSIKIADSSDKNINGQWGFGPKTLLQGAFAFFTWAEGVYWLKKKENGQKIAPQMRREPAIFAYKRLYEIVLV